MIEIRDLTKRYGSTVAVDHLTFAVRPGRVTGFLGPNGAGKSTTMRLVLGLDEPDSGAALVAGRPYRRLARPLHHVGAVLDATAVHGGRSGYHHLLWVARSNGIGPARVRETLERVGLTDAARRRVGGFSLGMRQRLGIAAALLGDPEILMLDEPVNGLDPEGIRWIRGLLRSLAAQGRTVLVSSHLMSEMALTADHLIVIGRGRLIADTSVADFIRMTARGDVFVRSARDGELAALLAELDARVAPEPTGGIAVTGLDQREIGDLAAAHGIPVYELTPRHASLEEVFMEVTEDHQVYRAQEGREPWEAREAR
ncbi:MAG TPA: ATP-binding cassette domain-containing protein [Streptosporangiaceae bacterium]|nr:ATP-binding cassette domain-containing protein [Streptosporangiaceae bacterium]